jgi:IclR family transcriptional regulator, acetate operon repressor
MPRPTPSAPARQKEAGATTGSGLETRADQTSIEAVDRAARILAALAASGRESSLLEVANRSELSKPTTFRILATLMSEGLVTQNDETSNYRLGVLPLDFAQAVLDSLSVREIARPFMKTVRDKVNESVVLSVRQDDFRVNIDLIEAVNAIGHTQQIGVPIPLYAGAASRVFLADLSLDELDAYLARTELVPFSPTTISEREKLLDEVARVRRDGFARSAAEFTVGSVAVACLVHAPSGEALASMHVSVPRSRASEDLLARAAEALKAAAAGLEREIAQRA